MWRDGERVFCEVALPESHGGDAGSFGLHPALLDSALHAAAAVDLLEDDGSAEVAPREEGDVRLPFSWNDVYLDAVGASSLRVCLSMGSDGDSIGLTAVDESGALVLSAGSLRTRAISSEQLRANSGTGRDSLFTVQWRPLQTTAQAGTEIDTTSEWVVLGAEDSPLATSLSSAGANVVVYGDVESLIAAIDDEAPVPDTVFLDLGDGVSSNVPELALSVACDVLEVLRDWLSAERLAGSRLVVLSIDAVPTGSGDGARRLAGSAAWGLVRSAQTENPERFVLIDVDELDGALGGLGGVGLRRGARHR